MQTGKPGNRKNGFYKKRSRNEMLKKAKNRKERGKSCIEVDSRKHRLYKVFAVKRGIKLKELAELAIDEYTKRK